MNIHTDSPTYAVYQIHSERSGQHYRGHLLNRRLAEGSSRQASGSSPNKGGLKKEIDPTTIRGLLQSLALLAVIGLRISISYGTLADPQWFCGVDIFSDRATRTPSATAPGIRKPSADAYKVASVGSS